jgi:hypothetical protein
MRTQTSTLFHVHIPCTFVEKLNFVPHVHILVQGSIHCTHVFRYNNMATQFLNFLAIHQKHPFLIDKILLISEIKI